MISMEHDVEAEGKGDNEEGHSEHRTGFTWIICMEHDVEAEKGHSVHRTGFTWMICVEHDVEAEGKGHNEEVTVYTEPVLPG
jgi:triosephosphate isomerase